jgi:hypothetical protein
MITNPSGQIVRSHRLHIGLIWIGLTSACTVKVENVEIDPINEYWKSDTVITIESNQMQLTDEYWVHRYSVPETNMLYEDWTAVDGTVSTYEFAVNLSENTFTIDIYMNEELDASGEGAFEGERWDWTGLEYGFLQPDGVNVVTVAQIEADSILYERVGYGMSGGADWTVDEVLTPLSEAEWTETFPAE